MYSFYKVGFNILKKFLIVGITLSTVIIVFSYFLKQDRPVINVRQPIEDNRKSIYSLLNDKKLNSTPQGKSAIAIYRIVNCVALGEACTNNPADGDKNFHSSVFGLMSNVMTIPYKHPPASGFYWAYSGLQETGFAPKTYAYQGIGFSAIQPFSTIWKTFRDLAFTLIVLYILIVGFMVMFRMKVNPQTVITLENSLPRVFIALLLITFSFPLVGFLIDVMYGLTSVAITVLAGNIYCPVNIANGANICTNNALSIQKALFSGNGGGLLDKIFLNGDYWGVGPAMFYMMPSTIEIGVRSLVAIALYLLASSRVIPGIGDFISGKAYTGIIETGGLPAAILQGVIAYVLIPIFYNLAPVALSLIVFFTGLFVFFRIFFLLFRSYIQILLAVIFAPIILIFEAIPGRKSFSKWIKGIIANLLVFPVVTVLIMLSNIIVTLTNIGAVGGHIWTPPFLYNPNPSAFSLLVGVGILFLIPDIVKLTKEFLGVKPSPLQAGLGLFFGGASGAGSQAMSSLTKFSGINYAVQSIGSLTGKLTGKPPKPQGQAHSTEEIPHPPPQF